MRIALIALVLFMMPLSGCLGGDPICCSGILYLQVEDSKGLDELHLIIEEIEVHYAGPDGELEGQEQQLTKELGVDVDIARAKDSWAVFIDEADLPHGEYTRFSITLDSAYGIKKDGRQVDVVLEADTFVSDQPFTINSDRANRAVMALDGTIDRSGGGYTLTRGATTVSHTFVEDSESGADVHEVGELVQLPELMGN